jgi:hypothetical protein
MSEELIQRDLVAAPDRIGSWDYYNIGATTLKALKTAKTRQSNLGRKRLPRKESGGNLRQG